MVSARCGERERDGERERERERDRERVFGFPMRALALLLVFGSTGSTANNGARTRQYELGYRSPGKENVRQCERL